MHTEPEVRLQQMSRAHIDHKTRLINIYKSVLLKVFLENDLETQLCVVQIYKFIISAEFPFKEIYLGYE